MTATTATIMMMMMMMIVIVILPAVSVQQITYTVLSESSQYGRCHKAGH